MTEWPHILVIYTGGTIGMIEDPISKVLHPFDFDHLSKEIPELSKLNCSVETMTLGEPVDSSNMNPEIWVDIATIIEEQYHQYDGFVILHGSDTMAFTASALSFMLENLAKPVILTGSQLPIGMIRTDGKENFLTAVEIAAAKKADGTPRIPEVCVYFEYKLYRGNRTYKRSADNFEAFESPNFPVLAEAGVHIKYNDSLVLQPVDANLIVRKHMDCSIGIVYLFPGIQKQMMEAVLLNPDLKAVIIHTYGAGNAPTTGWFLDLLRQASDQGKVLVNLTQCTTGSVDQGRYSTGREMLQIGVIGGRDMTLETTVTKLMYLLGVGFDNEEIKRYLGQPLRGELS